jgi:hypothetical protein
MDEQDNGLRKWLVPMGILAWSLEVGQRMWLIIVQAAQSLLRLSTIHMGQMMPSEPSNILFWTYYCSCNN